MKFMRLIRITTNYISYLQQFYATYPYLKSKSYELQYRELMGDCFGWSDFWTHALTKLGYEVWEPVSNAEIMQKTWAKEKGFQYNKQTWLTDITKAQVKFFKPDVLFVDDYSTFNKDFLLDLRQSCPSIKLILGWCGAPYYDASVFLAYDIVLSNIPELVIDFQKSGHKAKYFRHAFDPRVSIKINELAHKNESIVIPCSFIGSIFAGKSAHNERAVLIQKLIEDVDIAVFSDIYRIRSEDVVLIGIKKIVYDIIKSLSKNHSIREILQQIPKIRAYVESSSRPSLPPQLNSTIVNQAKPPVFGLEMFQSLYNSQVTLNNHIDLSRNSASNMRLFEATGVGTCLVTDWKENLYELFEADHEVVTYRSNEECVEKIKWLLDNPKEREKIAKSGQIRTLRDHTFDKRAVYLDLIIKETIKDLSTKG